MFARGVLVPKLTSGGLEIVRERSRGRPGSRRGTVKAASAGAAAHTGTHGIVVEKELGFVTRSVRVPERLIRMSIAAMVPMFGAIAAIMMFSREGPKGAVAQAVTIVVIASTIPASAVIARANLGPLWWTRQSRSWGVNTVFVLYADIGVSTILFAFTRPEAALFGAQLLAIVSVYAVYFCSPTIRNVHMAITTAVITALAIHTWLAGGYNLAATLGRFFVAVAVVNGTVVLQSMFAFGVRKGMRNMLVHAHQDPLTQLWNRRGFAYWAMATVQGSEGPVGMLFIDIDDFKSINDTHGHQVGDEVLQLAAGRLKHAVGSRGVLARTGGDEFAVVTELDHDEVIRLAESVRAGIHQPDDTVPVTTTIGAAAGWRDNDAFDRVTGADHIISTMLHAADAALYEAKQAGRNRVACVDLNNDDQGA